MAVWPEEITHQRIERVRSNRDLTKRPGWTLDLAVMVSGQPVGMQSLSGFDQWPHHRIVATASWLLAPFQRRLGTCSRAAVLELAFSYLHAESAKSWVLEENEASVSVSTKLGYALVDSHELTEDSRRSIEQVYRLDRDTWLQSPIRRRFLSVISGAQPLIGLLTP